MTIASYPLVTLLLNRAFLRKKDPTPQQSELSEQPAEVAERERGYSTSGSAMEAPPRVSTPLRQSPPVTRCDWHEIHQAERFCMDSPLEGGVRCELVSNS